VFCAKSAEVLEKNRDKILHSAKNDKRVRKSLKTKEMSVGRWQICRLEGWEVGEIPFDKVGTFGHRRWSR
jgi:hypothetical protein